MAKRIIVTKAEDFTESLIDHQFNLIVRTIEENLFKHAQSATEVTVSFQLENNPKWIHRKVLDDIKAEYNKAGWDVQSVSYNTGGFTIQMTVKPTE